MLTLLMVASGARARRALQLSGITEKEAQGLLRISQAHFSRQISGEEALNVHRWEARLPGRFTRWFHFLGVLEHGLPDEILCGVQLDRALRRDKQMAKMALPRAAAKESA